MTELNNEHRSNWKFIMLVFLIVTLGVIYLCTQVPGLENIKFTRHAQTSHANQIEEIDNCFSGGGTISPLFQTASGRWGQHCNDGKKGYWRIYDCAKEGGVIVVTQFKQHLRQLIKYKANHDMRPVSEIQC